MLNCRCPLRDSVKSPSVPGSGESVQKTLTTHLLVRKILSKVTHQCDKCGFANVSIDRLNHQEATIGCCSLLMLLSVTELIWPLCTALCFLGTSEITMMTNGIINEHFSAFHGNKKMTTLPCHAVKRWYKKHSALRVNPGFDLWNAEWKTKCASVPGWCLGNALAINHWVAIVWKWRSRRPKQSCWTNWSKTQQAAIQGHVYWGILMEAKHQLDAGLLSSHCQVRDASISEHGLFFTASGPDQGFC